ncbi:unnamed protein product [Spirodela intermedia]|uniref:Uncharacterized protein n=1 Tax=Spirodela intermedia TaxID=51605 RepID=A0A7I8IYZ4_SPIIN|nr:unnamed protein product [Spirodela intermedia]CAA6662242.1 unnamed protein product [Spirodela intermedia]
MDSSRRETVVLALLLSLFGLSSALDYSIVREDSSERNELRSDQEMRWLYEEWIVNHDKSYSDEVEKAKRFEIFKDNLRFVDDHNRPGNNNTYTVGLNQFADLSDEEFRSMYLGPPLNLSAMPSPPVSKRYIPKRGQYLPTSVDWRRWGAVSAVKNQGVCESCRAFATVATVESLHKIVTGRMITLSEQELVDCDSRNEGCKPGYIYYTYQYIVDNGGIDTDGHYPYRGVAGQCRTDRRRVVRISGFRKVPSRNSYALQYAVAYQPVSVLIEAYSRGFRFHKSGVFTGPCGEATDHFLTVIGYGTDYNGIDYWLVKNSWGTSWGEGGFGKIQRNAGGSGRCAILSQPQYPVMNKWVKAPSGKSSE